MSNLRVSGIIKDSDSQNYCVKGDGHENTDYR